MSSLFDVVRSHILAFEDQLYTACPAVVEKYNPTDCTVDVYPTVFKKHKDGVLMKDMLLGRVPLHFPATKELGITYPVRKGDTVLLVFSHSDTENWLTKPDEFVKPKSYRKHSMNDAIAICGMFKYDASPVQTGTEQDLNIRYKDTFVRLKQNGNIEGYSPTEIKLSVGASSYLQITPTGIVLESPRIDLNP